MGGYATVRSRAIKPATRTSYKDCFCSPGSGGEHGPELLVEVTRHSVDVRLSKLAEGSGRAVILERYSALSILAQEHPDRRIQCGRDDVPGHPPRRKRIA